MKSSRLEAFSDGVIAILITIMVLYLRPPKGTTIGALSRVVPIVLTYILSFLYLGIYWNNHHHMFQLVKKVNGAILWANLFLLFSLSLFPFATDWLGQTHFAVVPTAAYGVILLTAAIAYYLLQTAIIANQGAASALRTAVGRDVKGKISPLLYLAGVFSSFLNHWVAFGIYCLVALVWLIPDRRVEAHFRTEISADSDPDE
ncbi:MAG: TMEM175 family protein [Firmicutes bacterium]|nr:TMEM175 family protein [Bacillota bacterium]